MSINMCVFYTHVDTLYPVLSQNRIISSRTFGTIPVQVHWEIPPELKRKQEGDMPWKLREDGTIEMENGNPVYVHADGKEVPFDADGALKSIGKLSGEMKLTKKQHQEAVEKLALFAAIEDPEAAIKAIETVKNLDAKKLVDAGQIDILKAEMGRTFAEKEGSLKSQWMQKEQEYQGHLKVKDEAIQSILMGGKFASSEFLKKTNLIPEIAANYFGKNFRIEGEGAEIKVVGYLNGERIPSREKFGEPADFDEALAAVIDAYPHKDRIMLAGMSSGSGSQGNKQHPHDIGKRFIDKNDVKGFADNLEAIAKGEVVVQG